MRKLSGDSSVVKAASEKRRLVVAVAEEFSLSEDRVATYVDLEETESLVVGVCFLTSSGGFCRWLLRLGDEEDLDRRLIFF